MKNCPNCHAEVEDSFELCWKCNYSFTEHQIINIKDLTASSRAVNCLRCKIKMIFSGSYKFHEGARTGILGNIFEIFVNREKFDLYVCSKCGKVEFFVPVGSVDKKF